MRLFHPQKLVLFTTLPQAEVFRKLNDNIKQTDYCSDRQEFADVDLLFEGMITNNSFCIKPAISYNNTFLPQITGEFDEIASGTKITLIMKPSQSMMKFTMMWISGISLCAILMLLSGFVKGGSSLAAIMPFAMLGLGIGMINTGFSTEIIKAKVELAGILDAHKIDL